MLDTLIIGGDGVIGRALSDYLWRRDHDVRLGRGDVWATTRKRPIEKPGYIPFDLRWPCALPLAKRVIFCTGVNGFKACEEDPLSRAVNVTFLLRTAEEIVGSSPATRLVYLSSSAAETHPETKYGTHKREAEFGILRLSGTVLRFGPVCIPGRHVYPNDVYTPISLETIKCLLSKSELRPGLHRLTTDPNWKCLCEDCGGTQQELAYERVPS
jgi:nucleoside-diphosphate-sugar epimerase